MEDNDTIICRCEDITLGEIHQLLDQGLQTLHDIKRVIRCGMGPCQGSTCIPLLIKIVAHYQGIDPSQVAVPTYRPPAKPIKLGTIVDSFPGHLLQEPGGDDGES